jgi:hypothetical protein
VTRSCCSGLLNFAAHSPEVANATEKPIMRDEITAALVTIKRA